jgi:hypothetical protein
LVATGALKRLQQAFEKPPVFVGVDVRRLKSLRKN